MKADRNTATQSAVQKGLLAFVILICLGLLMVPNPGAQPYQPQISSPDAEIGYGGRMIAQEGLRP